MKNSVSSLYIHTWQVPDGRSFTRLRDTINKPKKTKNKLKNINRNNSSMEKRRMEKQVSAQSRHSNPCQRATEIHENTVNIGNAKKLIASFHLLWLSWKMIALL